MNFQEVRDRVFDNLGTENQSQKVISQINFEILSELKVVHRLSEIPSKTHSFAITDSGQKEIAETMPNDFFLPLGVRCTTTDPNTGENNVVLSSVEIPRERYFRWEPTITNPTDAGGAVWATVPTEPKRVYQTPENFDYDGAFGWYFEFSDSTWILHGKLPYNGQISVLYVEAINFSIGNTDNMSVLPYYEDVVVDGTTLRMYRKLLARAKTEIELLAIRSAIGEYKTAYKYNMEKLTGSMHKTSELEAKLIQPFSIFDPGREAN